MNKKGLLMLIPYAAVLFLYYLTATVKFYAVDEQMAFYSVLILSVFLITGITALVKKIRKKRAYWSRTFLGGLVTNLALFHLVMLVEDLSSYFSSDGLMNFALGTSAFAILYIVLNSILYEKTGFLYFRLLKNLLDRAYGQKTAPAAVSEPVSGEPVKKEQTEERASEPAATSAALQPGEQQVLTIPVPVFLTKVGRGLKKLLPLLKKIITAPFVFFKKRPKLFFTLIAIAVLAAGGKIGWSIWQSSQPQPISISFSIRKPGKTDYEKGQSKPLTVNFNGSAALLEDIGKNPGKPIVMNPPVSGEWIWEADNQLVFTPSELWAIGQEYSVEMDKTLFPEHIELNKYSFDFEIDSFYASLKSPEFYIDPENSAIKRVLATVTFNYPVDEESLRDKIVIRPDIKTRSGRLDDREYSYTLTFSDDKLTAWIVSEPLGMPADTVEMNVSLKKGIVSAYGGNASDPVRERGVDIPGASSYVRVNSLNHSMVKNSQQLYDQIFVLDTKGEIHHEELRDNIEVWMLPVDRPELPGIRKNKDHNWRRIEEIVPEVLKLAEKVDLKAIPNERDISSVNSFRFEVPQGRYLYVKLKEGTRFYGDYFLSKNFEKIFRVKDYPKEVSILSEGSLLSLSGDKKLPLMTRGISSVQVSVARIRPDDLNHLVTQSRGRIDDFNFTNYRFNEENISEIYRKTVNVGNSSDPRAINYGGFSLSGYLDTIPSKNLRYGLFLINVKGDYPHQRYSDRRLVMVTDLGFYVKSSRNGTKDIFVQSIATGEPVPQAEVEVWGKNGNPVFKGRTSATGRIQIPSLSGHHDEDYPTVFVVKKYNDLAFMPYNDNGQVLDYSDFDVGGVYDSQDSDKLDAFVFSDRGIYRPGDKFNIGTIIKSGDWSRNLAGTPLEVTVTDPKGAEVYTKYIKLDSSGFSEFNYQTQSYSPTGSYTASVYVIKKDKYRDFLGSTQVKVEEFLPDTLRVDTTFKPSPSAGWVSPGNLKGLVSVKNLFGTPAAGNSIRLQLNLSPGYKRFRKFRDYRFFDPYLKDNNYSEFLGEFTTDSQGEFEIPVNLEKFEEATYNVSLRTEAFEKASGRSVTSQASIMVSPAEYMIGYKADGALNYINKNSERNVQFIAVNSKLDATEVSGLTLVLSETRFISSLVKQPNGVYKYQSKKREYRISEKPFTVSKEGTLLSLPTDRAGEFSWKILKDEETMLTSGHFSIIGDKNTERSLDRTAELEIRLNKGDFKPGEEIEVFIKGPYKGSGLITIEQDRVYTHKWFHSAGESVTTTITVPEDLEGNGYVSVTLIRDQESKEIYMSPLSYGVVPFSVSKESRTNVIELDIPAEARPGEVFPITYSISNPGKIVVFAVDEGILQVAKYKTPQPLSHFFKKRALQVETSQILDLILPEFSVAQSLGAMGGGADYEMLKRNLNPFKRKTQKPVAYWSGILDADSSKRTVEYKVPDYFNGTLKVMAVAVSRETVGSAEKSSIVRSPFVIRPNVPTLAAPGDIMDISVTVTNVKSGSGDNVPVVLSASTSKHLSIEGEAQLQENIDEGRDKTFHFKVKASGPVGAGEMTFTVKAAGEEVKISSYLSVRPPVPFQTLIDTGVVKHNKESVTVPRKLYDEYAVREVTASYLPAGMAKGLNTYLSNYPYGCTEQITSATFPKLFPESIKNLKKSRGELSQDIQGTISILQSRQKSDGGFGLWTARSGNHATVDNHVMFFLTKAREKGHFVPKSLYDAGLNRLKEIASSDSSFSAYIPRAFAIYILSLNEIVTTSYIEKLEKDLKRNFKEWKSSYAGLYLAGSYSLLQQQSKAVDILNNVGRKLDNREKYDYYDHLSFYSLYLHILSEHAPKRLKTVSEDLLLDMAEQLSGRRFSTYSASSALLAIESFLKASPSADQGPYVISEVTGDVETSITMEGEKIAVGGYSSDAEKIIVNGNGKLNLFYQVINAGFSAEPPVESHNGIEIYREYLDSKGNVQNTFGLGDVAEVRIKLRATTDDIHYNVAIVDMIPAGFEIDIESVRSSRSGFDPDYIDIREDRVVLFGTVEPRSNEFSYKIRAVNPGTFKVPPSYGESMYDQTIWSVRPLEDIVVKPEERR